MEWVLDQYRPKKPKDPTIAEKFDNYRFSAHKEAVVAEANGSGFIVVKSYFWGANLQRDFFPKMS
jgi:hypothetical protein